MAANDENKYLNLRGLNTLKTELDKKYIVPYRYQTNGTTTYLKIKINSKEYWMMSFDINLYQGYVSHTIRCSGYNYGVNNWYSPKAYSLGKSNTEEIYFGHDGSQELWVGIKGGNYTGLSISNIVMGYQPIKDSEWDSLFTIENVSVLGGTTDATIKVYPIVNSNEIGNGTITINQAGSKKGSFTVNQSGDATIDLTDSSYNDEKCFYKDGSRLATGYFNMNGHNLRHVSGTYRSAGERFYDAAIEIREADLVTNTQTDKAYAPRIGFHWGSVAAASLILNHVGDFELIGQNDTSYRNIHAAGFIKSNDNNVLLAGGGEKPLSEFLTTFINLGDATLKLYQVENHYDPQNPCTETFGMQSCFDGRDGETTTDNTFMPGGTAYPWRSNIALQPKGGNVFIGKDFKAERENDRLMVNGNVRADGFKKVGSSDSQVLLGGGGVKDVSYFITENATHTIPASSTINTNSCGFGYSSEGFATNGSFISFGGFGAHGYCTQIQGKYNESGDALYYRTYNGDTGITNDWRRLANASELKNPTDYYWADQKVQSSSDRDTSPTFEDVYAETLYGKTSSATIGLSSSYWNAGYIHNIYTSRISGQLYGDQNIHIGPQTGNPAHVYLDMDTVVRGYMNPAGNSVSGQSLGKSNAYWYQAYVTEGHFNIIAPKAGNGSGWIGASSSHWQSGYINDIYAENVLPQGGNQSGVVGNSNRKWYGGYFYTFHYNFEYHDSDIRLKNVIGLTDLDASSIINKMSVKDYTWKSDPNPDSPVLNIGYIAQELQSLIPDKYKETFVALSDPKDPSSYLNINTDSIIFLTIKALQEQIARNNELERKNKSLEERLARIEKALNL